MGFFPISSQGVRNFTSCRRRRRRAAAVDAAATATTAATSAAAAVAAPPVLPPRCRRTAAIFTATTAPRSTAALCTAAALYAAALPQLVESFCCLLQFKPTDTTRVYFAGAELNYSVSAQRAEYQKKTSAKVGFHL